MGRNGGKAKIGGVLVADFLPLTFLYFCSRGWLEEMGRLRQLDGAAEKGKISTVGQARRWASGFEPQLVGKLKGKFL